MVTKAVEVVSVADIKAELRITDYNGHDSLLSNQIAAAVSFVSRSTTRTILEETRKVQCLLPLTLTPIRLRLFDIISVEAFKYWSADGALRDDTDGTLEVDDLGRRGYLDPTAPVPRYEIWPPADGWPEALPASRAQITLKFGIDDAADIPPSLRQAVILGVRQLYDGYREIRPTEAFYALIAPWRRFV